MKRSRALAKRKAGQSIPDNEVGPVKEKRRLKTFQTVMHIDNMIKVATNNRLGLADFQQVPNADGNFEKCPFEWKVLSLAPDRGPDNVCCDSFLICT